MCGRFVLAQTGILPEHFGFVDFHDTRLPPPRYNIAPSQAVLVIAPGPAGPAARPMGWGFRPAWMTDPKRPPPINARAESLIEGRLFRGALRHGRCMIPADGFYEWVAVPGGRRKRPMHIRLKGGGLFAFAGLCTADADELETCAIVTTGANELIRTVHDRMPVILDREAETVWLDPATPTPEALAVLQPYPPERMELYEVGPEVSSGRADGPDLIRPLGS
jgi:putative SOS response-associated peptidase YedK